MLSTLTSAAELAGLVKDEDAALKLLVDEGVLTLDRICKNCGSPMALRKRKNTFEMSKKQKFGLFDGRTEKKLLIF
ncbi:hypothetical protein GCK72_004608 [Caenorhabditis remanei]|uniref:Uncharacterized protein n=1 Tax=Caenorhabditis remanei TaxID=31234 RepID=A0A6A5HC94_CAERE|nr:hypothetical protein GCK72_004608 [Caenorhabditis remanei]KAF1764659.1 hypothetical protein GCK72_004608 [Caenorhabditis remanei]